MSSEQKKKKKRRVMETFAEYDTNVGEGQY